MTKTGKLVGVCNCKCHCTLEECFTEHDLRCDHCGWKPVDDEFYRQLDIRWKERKNDPAWVEMYEKTKLEVLGKSLIYEYRINKEVDEIEVRKLGHNTDSKECWCNPKLEKMPNGSFVIVHRKLYEKMPTL